MKDKLNSRINRVIGQLEAIKNMLNGNEECEKVSVQFKAVYNAIGGIFRDYLHTNALQCNSKKPEMLKKILDMIIK